VDGRAAYGTAPGGGEEPACSDFGPLRQGQRVLNVNPGVPDGVLDLRVPEQEVRSAPAAARRRSAALDGVYDRLDLALDLLEIAPGLA
jgi:hypothetical protein